MHGQDSDGLVETNLEQDAMSLDDKIALMREKGAETVKLNGKDFTKLNLRFTQTALAKMGPVVQSAWADASKGRGKIAKQHDLLTIFAEHGIDAKNFVTKVKEFTEKQRVTVSKEWMSRTASFNNYGLTCCP